MSISSANTAFIEANKATVGRWFDGLNAGMNLDELTGELFAPGYALNFAGMPTLDRDGAIGVLTGFLNAFPGIHHAIEDQVAEGDSVATRITVRGTHMAELMGIPATGRSVEFGAINVHRFSGGKIAEQWVIADMLGMMQQLGVVPPPPTRE